MIFLSSGLKYTLAKIAERFEMSERTASRYIQTFREAGFIIPKPEYSRYFIDKNSPYFKEISELLHFSKDLTLARLSTPPGLPNNNNNLSACAAPDSVR